MHDAMSILKLTKILKTWPHLIERCPDFQGLICMSTTKLRPCPSVLVNEFQGVSEKFHLCYAALYICM